MLAPDCAAPALDDLCATLERGLAEVLATESADPLTVMNDVLKVMSAQVTVRPSGPVFFVDGRDSLLQAGLKAGLKLAYGCGNGTCGLCKARVIEGAGRQDDAVRLPAVGSRAAAGAHAALRAFGRFGRDRHRDAGGAAARARFPSRRSAVRVRAVQPLAADTLLLHLQTPRTSRLRFLAGQSVTLYGGAGGADAHATYPIASCPCDDRNLHFHVGRDSGDALAAMLHTGAIRAGDTLQLWGPTGALRARGVRAPLGVRRLRHRIRADQESHRARDGHRGHRVDLARLARGPCGRTLPREPVPRLGRGASTGSATPRTGGRLRPPAPAGGRGDGAVDRRCRIRRLRRRTGARSSSAAGAALAAGVPAPRTLLARSLIADDARAPGDSHPARGGAARAIARAPSRSR